MLPNNQEVTSMNTKEKTRLAGILMAALAVLGIGGAAIAQTGGSAPAPTKSTVPTTKTVQPGAPAPADTDTVQEESGADDATEANEPAGANEPNEANKANEAIEVEDESPSYTSSIVAPHPADDGSETADDEAAEAAALADLATITADQAQAAALAAVPGTVIQVELDNENGSVVYSVEVDTGNGIIDVKVDAGNGTVLHQDADDEGESEG